MVQDAFGTPQSLLVLGGASDIGVATARAMVARGTQRVILAGRNPEALAGAAAQIATAGPATVDLLHFEALEYGAHKSLIDEAFDRHHGVDAALITVGAYHGQERCDNDGLLACDVIGANFTAAVSVSVSLVQRFRAQGHGVIIVMSSAASQWARPSEYAYAAAKAGLDVYFRALGQRLQGSGVAVLLVRPGFIRTKMTTDRRPAAWAREPSDVANAIVDGLRRRERVVWVPPALRWGALFARLTPGRLLAPVDRFLG
jgi:decaprenylphospho-beta-D-erythro-pentofuranosid-2-ulose 2-reductase